jgi:peptidyl-prolyl cis-trans isomerase SurA
LDSIRKEIVSNKISFGEAVNKYSDDESSKFSGGAVTSRDGSTYINFDQLDKEMVVLIQNMKPGDVSTPQLYVDDRGRKTLRIVYYKERTAPHKENLREDYNRVSVRALEEKKSKVLESWFKDRVPNYYVFIDNDFQACKELTDWTKVANAIVKEKTY